MISTTLNIHASVLSKIVFASERLKKTRKQIIVMLLMRLMQDLELPKRCFSTVKYQQDDNKENWHCFHVRFQEDENEFFVDLRKISKFSVSLLVAIGVERYLASILRSDGSSVDNNAKFKHYVLYHEVVYGIISFRIYWGFPTGHLKTLKL